MGCIAREQMARNAVARERLFEAAQADGLAVAADAFAAELTRIGERIAAIHAAESGENSANTANTVDTAGTVDTEITENATGESIAGDLVAGGPETGELETGESESDVGGVADGTDGSPVTEPAVVGDESQSLILAVLERRQAQLEKLRSLVGEIATASGEERKTLVERIPGSLVYDVMSAQFGAGNFDDPRLEVEFVLATEPSLVHHGRVVELHDYAEIVDDEQGVTVQVRVAFDRSELNPEQIRQGATASAKIHCGRASIGYCWFYDLISWTKKTWFRWFY
ncbi:MAG: hypothetical protein Q4C47_07305, partial [Planctomycetia bacterium]|nr:hypothetical protein [Planctomycetia bacterium]